MKNTIHNEFIRYISSISKRRKREKSFFWNLVNRLTLIITDIACKVDQRLYLSKQGDEKIFNIGCGSDIKAECINFDIIPRLDKFLRCRRIRQLWFNSDVHPINITRLDKRLINKADGIIMHHVLEHIPVDLVFDVFTNIHKYLKKDGIVRISVPTYDPYVDHHISSLECPQDFYTKNIALNNLFYSWGHQYIYDIQIIQAIASNIGFSKCVAVEYKKGIHSNFDDLSRSMESIYIEISK